MATSWRSLMTASFLTALLAVVDGAPARADAGHAEGGRPGHAEAVDRTIRIDAVDVAFTPASIRVRIGETVRFVVTNRGELIHDFTLGDPDSQRAHREAMAAMLDAAGKRHDDPHGHADGNAIMLQPGETRELVWTFGAAEAFEFACNVPGHYESGMVGRIVILPHLDPAPTA